MSHLQIFFVIFVIVGMTGIFGYPGYDDGAHGYGGGYEPKYPPHPYGFGYEIKDHLGNQQYRKEHSDGKKVIGSYGFTDAHGIHRLVDYVADEHGFRAKVRTNEPGTANQDPANVHIQSTAYHGPIGDYH
ncbi:cuticle protein 10.9-like [Argiope bruennichi]|uniref:Cuticle protein 16.8 like protein n=1 Tax=Argiope bruennichi TaxID=94029 RepID=A0A8T0EVF3_ARGBR|nr:cuticle protein 10.9-like [Argiope bruennichi]KAF8782296.1 Cuticle protein 16.8 like protein [Argiope bruennichi]